MYMVRFAQLRREDCKCRILTGKGHAFKTKLRLWDPLLSPWKQEIQLEDELTKLPRRGKLLTSLPWWWLRDVVVVCWSLFYSNFVLTFTFPTIVLHCCCCCCKGELLHAAFFPVFFPSLFRTPWKLACKNWSFFAHRTILRYSFQGTQRPDHRSADLTVLKRYYSRIHLCLPYHSSTCFPCVDDTFEEKKSNPAQNIPWYVTTHTPSSFLWCFITELKNCCHSGTNYVFN